MEVNNLKTIASDVVKDVKSTSVKLANSQAQKVTLRAGFSFCKKKVGDFEIL